MPSYPQWLESLEEHAYLVQMLSEAAHDQGALEHTCDLLEVLRADLCADTLQVVDSDRENRESTATSSKVYHSVASTTSPDKEKRDYGVKGFERQNHLLAVWTTKRTLSIEVRNLEIKAQILRRQKRHQDELQHRLVALFARITEERKPPSREEEETEEDARRAQLNLYGAQKMLDRNKTLEALLRHGDYSLINAGRHLTGGSGGSSGIDAAMKCAVQTSVVVNQARRLDPSFFEQEAAEVLKVGWLHEVFQATSADDSQTHPLLQALKPHHTALLSLIPQAHERTSESDAAVRRAAHQSSEARARRDAVKRHVLLTWASAEAERHGEISLVNKQLEQDGLAKERNITVGLEGVIPIAGAQHSFATISTPYSSEEQQRMGQNEPASRPSPIFIPQPRAPQPSRQPLPSNLTPDIAPPLRSAPLPTPPSTSDPGTQRGAPDKQLRQPSLATPQPHSADPTQRRFSPADAVRQPKPIHQQNRHPVLDQQYDRSWQPESGDQYDLNVRSHRKLPSKPSERDDATFQSQTQAYPGQPLSQNVQPSAPSLIPPLPIQQNAESLQPQSSNFSNPSADSRPPSEKQDCRSGTSEHRPMPPPVPQSQPVRPLPQVNTPLLYQSDSHDSKQTRESPPKNTQLGRAERQTASSSSRSSPKPPQAAVPIPSTSTAILSSHRPAVHGILKQVPSTPGNADPWGLGVKVAAAPSSHPQPKLKSVFNLWRSAESSKTSRSRVTSQPEPQAPPPLPPKQQNPRAAMQMLRFSEGVEIIPRPGIDSDPYDDEEDDKMPPSPTRGSVIWLDNDKVLRESSDDSSGDLREMERRRDVAEVPANTGSAIDPSQSSISSNSSSSHFTEYSTFSTTTPPSSESLPPHILTYHTSQENGWTPPRDQLDMQKCERDDSKRITDGALESTSKNPSTVGWVSRVYTMSPQPVSGHTMRDDDLPRTDIASPNPDNGRLMSSPRPNAVPNPTPSYGASRQMTRENMKSDRELLQTIFPSPAQSSISQRDLMFIS